MSRSFGCTLLTTRSPIEIVPEVMFSSPASILSRVDLPQPDGPTRTTNAPSSIGTVTPCRTSKPPNDLRTSLICTDAIHIPPDDALGVRPARPSPFLLCRASYQTFSPMSLDHSRIVTVLSRHSGMRPLGRRPGIHNHHSGLWIPDSRRRPGMTALAIVAKPANIGCHKQ